jgi:acetyl esterase/lipase
MFAQLLLTATSYFIGRVGRRAIERPKRLASMASFWPDLVVSELSPQISFALGFVVYRCTGSIFSASPFEAVLDGLAAASAIAALVPTVKLAIPLITSRAAMLAALEEAGLEKKDTALTSAGLSWKKALISLFPLPVFTGLNRNIEIKRGVTFATATSTVKRRSKAEQGADNGGPFVLHEDHHPRIVSLGSQISLDQLPSQSLWEAAQDSFEASSAMMWGKGKGRSKGHKQQREPIHTNLKLDLFWHKKRYGTAFNGKAPIALVIHGGGWIVGHSINSNLPLIYALAREGYLVASVNYRLAPGAHFPSQLADVKAAIAWLKMHSKQFSADPDFIVTLGESAGGHLSLLACLTGNVPEFEPFSSSSSSSTTTPIADTSVQGIVDLYGVSDWVDARGVIYGKEAGFRNFLGRFVLQTDHHMNPSSWMGSPSSASASSRHSSLAEFISASPRWWLEGSRLKESLTREGVLLLEDGQDDNHGSRAMTGNGLFPAPSASVMRRLPALMSSEERSVPPILIAHGIADNLVPFKDSEELWDALQQHRRRWKGVRGEVGDCFIKLPATHHAFNYLVSVRSLALSDAVADWMNALWREKERSGIKRKEGNKKHG